MTFFEGGSFRDRSARVLIRRDGVFRWLDDEGLKAWNRVSATPFFPRLMAEGQIVSTRELSRDETAQLGMATAAAVLQHETIPFISYPYEWSFGMLRQAALLHLRILSEAIDGGLMLKDASPYNVQFRGTRPVFIDIGSFVPMVPGEPWSAYRQFCEMMLFPLLVQAYKQVDFHPLLRGALEGISTRQFMQWMSWRDLLRPGVFAHGWLQSRLERHVRPTQASTVRDLKSSGFTSEMIRHNLRQLTRLLERLEWKPDPTIWTNYRTALPHVIEAGDAKRAFVGRVCQLRQRSLVWDLGCNDGEFARIAADSAQTVVAMDADHGCVERLYRSLLERPAPAILPLCIDLANPSPAQGWRGLERKRLEERGRPDLVLCLGLIHHLVIGHNIPLDEVIDWLAGLGGELVIEFPSKKDAMVRTLLRNKPDQYSDYSLPALEAALHRHFTVVAQTTLPGGERTLLHAVPLRSNPGAT